MPVLKILDQDGNEVENAQIQDGAQVNVIEKITINGDTIQIGADKDIDIDLDSKVDKKDGYGLITESALEEGTDEFGLTSSGKIFQIDDKTADSFYNKDYLEKLRESLFISINNKVEKQNGYDLAKLLKTNEELADEFEITPERLTIYISIGDGGGAGNATYSKAYLDNLRKKIAEKLTLASNTDIEGVFSNA